MTDSDRQQPEWWSPQLAAKLRLIRYDFHVRAFGEEMARINSLPLDERRAEVGKIYDHAKANGVKFDKPTTGYTQ